ncbi:MAG: polyprenyl synthetase family protein [Chloroflexi bacterium]|nr:polyprenyl synthetase family protein [Chloroflexota bacterium]
MDYAKLYTPIAEELPLVDQAIQEVGRVEFPWLSSLLRHVLSARGKRLRPVMTLLAGRCFAYDPERLVPMAASVELLHTATLVHDDTLDGAARRRGIPTVNQAWSSDVAVLFGDYLFAASGEMVSRTRNVRAMRLFAQTLMEVCNGEMAQHFAAYQPELTREEYFRRISKKTGALFALATESGAFLSAAPEPLVHQMKTYGHQLGIAFQIADDILDFAGDETTLGKPVGGDLAQGTLTLPVILLMERYPRSSPARDYLEHGRQPEDLERTIRAVCDPDLLAEAYRVAAGFSHEAAAALDPVPDSAARRCLLALAEYALSRRS